MVNWQVSVVLEKYHSILLKVQKIPLDTSSSSSSSSGYESRFIDSVIPLNLQW